MSRIVFLAGVPSVGKSFYADWAEREQRVAHIDAEMDDWGKTQEFRAHGAVRRVPSWTRSAATDGISFSIGAFRPNSSAP